MIQEYKGLVITRTPELCLFFISTSQVANYNHDSVPLRKAFAAYSKETDSISESRVSERRFRQNGVDGKNSREKGSW